MPPTGAATKVKDPEYSNWLKVSLALYYLTVGLHSFIQGEVDAMHQFLLQKLYGGSSVPKPKCSSCISKDVKQNRNTYVWRFKSSCPSHLCDIWLAELLTLHTNPTANKIYWDNCDVTAWPFVPWECAKLYMPRGQLPANTGPVKCDSQALLTLMANCTYFHKKLSSAGLGLTRTVSKIRNSVMHSEEMRLSSGDSKSFIQDIIHLLEDQTHLKSMEECKQAVNEIKKIDNDSVAVFFNEELERLALMTAVNAVRQDMGKQEERTLGSVESLKEEYIQLKEQMRTKIAIVENRQDTFENRVGIVENRQDTFENRVGIIENRLQTFENCVGIVENRQDTIGRDVDSAKEQTYATLQSLEQTNTALQSLEKEHKEMQKNVQSVLEKTQQQLELSQAISASVAPLGVRVEAVEETLTRLQESGHRTVENIACKEEDTSNWQQMAHTYHPLHLRDYQLELAKDAVHGENTIICAETGSGKTWVALYIAKNHLESASSRKKLVVFMAKTNPLIQQQHRRFMHSLLGHRTKLITAESEESLKLNMFVPYHDIICLTPQILLNNLEKQTVSLSDFSLMILDECHHTKKDESYNRLMRKYLMAKVKNNVPNLPQIVGLTASLGVGKSKTEDEAVEYIIHFMANLDTCKLSTVEKYKEEIEKYVSRPKEVTIPMKDRLDDMCKKRILYAMNEVQEKLTKACHREKSMSEIESKRPDLKSQQYVQWARNLETIAESLKLNPETARLIISCAKYLVTFSEALELNSLLGILDVCRFLARKFNPEKERQSKHTEEESELLQLILKVHIDLNGYDENKSQMNPNLQTISNTLRELILAENDDQESRALVFVQARATCTALAKYLDGVLSKDNIHVHKLTGKEGDDSMTSAEYTETVDKFVSGEYKVLVATSVAGEGIDIPDCNIVLSYNYAGNEITKIQMTGRGRKKDGKNIVMGYEKTLEKEKLNTYKADMMYRAMESIKKMELRTLQQKIRFLQKSEIDKQELYDRNLKMQKSKKIKCQFKLCCLECATEVIDGENLRVFRDTYRIVIDKEFRHLIDVKSDEKPTPKKILGGLQKTDRICCKKCGKDWGTYFVYEKLLLPTIKIKSFKIPNDGKFSIYDNWNKLPFEIETCELSELINLLEK